jgi:hypothetical protein
VYNGNFDITRMLDRNLLDQSNLNTQCCPLIFCVECSVGGYLVLAKTSKDLFFNATFTGFVYLLMDKRFKISERIEEYKLIYKFYRQLLHLYKVGIW